MKKGSFIDDLPIKIVIFQFAMLNYQRLISTINYMIVRVTIIVITVSIICILLLSLLLLLILSLLLYIYIHPKVNSQRVISQGQWKKLIAGLAVWSCLGLSEELLFFPHLPGEGC